MARPEHPLYLLAGDHRNPHLAALLDLSRDPGPEERPTLVRVKETIADALDRAVTAGADPASVGLLIDDEYGGGAARAAVARGRLVAMPVEASGLDHFALADPGIVTRVLEIGPAWVKALVRYNVEGDHATNAASVAGLTELRARLALGGTRLMLEVVVPPTPAQLASAGNEEAFIRTRRPALVAQGVTDLLVAGIEPDLWKVEGIDDPEAAATVVAAAHASDRDAGLVVLGAGAPMERVNTWLRVAATTPGYVGFAIGRSLWWNEIRDMLNGRISRASAADHIDQNMRRAIAVFESPSDTFSPRARQAIPGSGG